MKVPAAQRSTCPGEMKSLIHVIVGTESKFYLSSLGQCQLSAFTIQVEHSLPPSGT